VLTDETLLGRYIRTGDPDAFGELVARYAGLVYGTCLRVLRNPHDAQDVAQECFLELSRRAAEIHASVAGWLHAVATRCAVDALRTRAVRLRHERTAGVERIAHEDEHWERIAPRLDAALADLPEELHTLLVRHYFQGATQTQLAEELGVNQSTVSRRIEKGLDLLRHKLEQTGVTPAVAALAQALDQHTLCPTPPSLALPLIEPRVPDEVATADASGFSTVSAKAFLVLAAAMAVVMGAVTCNLFTSSEPPVFCSPIRYLASAADADEPARELLRHLQEVQGCILTIRVAFDQKVDRSRSGADPQRGRAEWIIKRPARERSRVWLDVDQGGGLLAQDMSRIDRTVLDYNGSSANILLADEGSLLKDYRLFPLAIYRILDACAVHKTRTGESTIDIVWSYPRSAGPDRFIKATFAKDPPYDVLSVSTGPAEDDAFQTITFSGHADIGEGIRFPMELYERWRKARGPRWRESRTARVELNKHLPGPAFIIDLPPRTQVTDHVAGTCYRTEPSRASSISALIRNALRIGPTKP